jgi:hypothetical protein
VRLARAQLDGPVGEGLDGAEGLGRVVQGQHGAASGWLACGLVGPGASGQVSGVAGCLAGRLAAGLVGRVPG